MAQAPKRMWPAIDGNPAIPSSPSNPVDALSRKDRTLIGQVARKVSRAINGGTFGGPEEEATLHCAVRTFAAGEFVAKRYGIECRPVMGDLTLFIDPKDRGLVLHLGRSQGNFHCWLETDGGGVIDPSSSYFRHYLHPDDRKEWKRGTPPDAIVSGTPEGVPVWLKYVAVDEMTVRWLATTEKMEGDREAARIARTTAAMLASQPDPMSVELMFGNSARGSFVRT